MLQYLTTRILLHVRLNEYTIRKYCLHRYLSELYIVTIMLAQISIRAIFSNKSSACTNLYRYPYQGTLKLHSKRFEAEERGIHNNIMHL